MGHRIADRIVRFPDESRSGAGDVMIRSPLRIVFVLLAALNGAAEAQTRATTGDLRVVTIDESGSPVPAVRMSITSAETGLSRSVETDAGGQASAAALPVGRYAMRAEAPGFRTVSIDDVAVELGTAIELRIIMRLASIDTTVEVVAVTPLADVHRSVIAKTISDEQIAALPIDRRNYISFAVLAPGVATDRTPSQGPAETSGFSVAGQSARANNIT
ncbi:MAG: carboxypeptidase regulatory-like domain-containing protein, partial [Acidobacteria bacterium]